MAFFEGSKMTAGYGDGPDIINSCTINVDKGEIVAILGPNGAGKSTAMKTMLGLLNLKSGSILIDGEDITMSATYTQGLDETPKTVQHYRHQMVGRFVIVDILADEELVGSDIELAVTVTDVLGTELSVSQQVSVYPHPYNL